MLSVAGSQFPGLLFVKTLFLVVSGRVFTFREVKRATFVPTRGHTTVAKQADGASTPTQCFFSSLRLCGSRRTCRTWTSGNSVVAAFSHVGSFCRCILRRRLLCRQPQGTDCFSLCFAATRCFSMGRCPRTLRALPKEYRQPEPRFSLGYGCLTRASSVFASSSRQSLVCDAKWLQEKPWQTPTVQTHLFLGTAPRCSWVQSKCGRACCAKGGGPRLRPSRLLSLLSCYRRGQAVLGVTAHVT